MKKEECYVAVKVVKSGTHFATQAQQEIKLLTQLRQHADKWRIVKIKDAFLHCKHYCIVLELLECNLFKVLKSTGFRGKRQRFCFLSISCLLLW